MQNSENVGVRRDHPSLSELTCHFRDDSLNHELRLKEVYLASKYTHERAG